MFKQIQAETIQVAPRSHLLPLFFQSKHVYQLLSVFCGGGSSARLIKTKLKRRSGQEIRNNEAVSGCSSFKMNCSISALVSQCKCELVTVLNHLMIQSPESGG